MPSNLSWSPHDVFDALRHVGGGTTVTLKSQGGYELDKSLRDPVALPAIVSPIGANRMPKVLPGVDVTNCYETSILIFYIICVIW